MSKGRILIVEDNFDNLALVRFLLEHADYEVLAAQNGRDGLAVARKERPDLVLMDLSLPKMDGWSATKAIKSDPKTAHIPLLALTAHTLPEDRRRAMQAGCDGYISKPIDIATFVDVVAQAIRDRDKKT
ncbi:MAG: response regulator [Chloroflexi bacterium]|nr:response regulator [Chloroflexota bacterium]